MRKIFGSPRHAVCLVVLLGTLICLGQSPLRAQPFQDSTRLSISDGGSGTTGQSGLPVHQRGYQTRLAQAPSGSSTRSSGGDVTQPRSFESVAEAVASTDSDDSIGLEELAQRVAEIQSENSDYQPSAFFSEYDGGFKISPRDKKETPFELKINGRLQFRWVGFARDSETFTNRAGTVDVPTRNDFEIERGRLEFTGYALDPKLKFYFNLDADTDDNHNVIFHDFWFDYDVSDHLTVRVGKAKVAGSYEWLESSTTTRFADRSLSTTYFRADRSVGIWFLGKTPNDVNYQVSVTNGFDSTDLEPEDVDNNFNYTGIFYKDFIGDVGKGYSDLKNREKLAVRAGSSFSYINTNPLDDGSPTAEQSFARVSDGVQLTDAGALAPGVVVNDFDHYMLSTFVNGKWRGFSFNAEYYARWLQNFGTVSGAPTGINDLFDSGFYTDVGYFLVPGKFEAIGRVSQIDGLFGDTWEYAAGWNLFYNESHKSKLTFDASVLEGAPASSSSPNFEIGQDGILYRLQYQIAF